MRDEMKLLRSLCPPASEPAPDLSRRAREALLATIATDARGRRGHAGRLRAHSVRRWIVPCLAVVALGAAGLGVAGSLGDWWAFADPPTRSDEVADVLDFSEYGPPSTESGRSEPDIARARTVAYAPGAVLVAAPTARGGYCLVPLPDRSKPWFVCFEGNSVDESFFLYWIDRRGDESAWYLLGRVKDDGAARMELFEHVTHPFEGEGVERLPGLPLPVDVGPGGFFLVRVPEALWPELDLAYGQVTVLDRDGTTLARSCHFLGAPPDSFLARVEGGSHGDPLATDAASAAAYPCPATGVVAEAVRMRPGPPRGEHLTGTTGRDIMSGERIELSSFAGRPLVLAVWDPHSSTAARLLRELDAFARRHPEARVLGVLPPGPEPPAERAVEDLALSFPTIAVSGRLTSLTPPGLHGPYILFLDASGRVVLELAARSRPPLSSYALVTQETLEGALLSANR